MVSRSQIRHSLLVGLLCLLPAKGTNLPVAAVYGARYISDRFLPDKAIDLVDEAASALRIAQESKPDELEALDRDIITLQVCAIRTTTFLLLHSSID